MSKQYKVHYVEIIRKEQTARGFQGGRDDIRLEGMKEKIIKVEQGIEGTGGEEWTTVSDCEVSLGDKPGTTTGPRPSI